MEDVFVFHGLYLCDSGGYYFTVISSETDSFFLPFALLLLTTFLPFTVDILSLKPCLFFLFLFDG